MASDRRVNVNFNSRVDPTIFGLMPAYVELAKSIADEDQTPTQPQIPACEVEDTGPVDKE